MTAEILSGIVGALLSLAFRFLPGLKVWFEELPKLAKQGIMAILLIVTAAVIFVLACAGLSDKVTCDQAGALALVNILIYAVVTNQSTYLLIKK